MVFQKYTSFPWLTVAENIEYGLKINGVPPAERAQIVAHLIEAVGSRASRNPTRIRSPAACSSAWPSPARWPSVRRSS